MVVMPGAASAAAAIANSAGAQGAAVAKGGTSFEDVMRQVEAVNTRQIEGDVALARFASGENVDLHGTFIALEKADITLRAMVSVRDRVVSAYEQVMGMSI